MNNIIKIYISLFILTLVVNIDMQAQHINFTKYLIDSDCRTTIEFFNAESTINYVLFDNTLTSSKYLVLYNEYFRLKELEIDNINDILMEYIFIPYPGIPSGKYTLKFISCHSEQPSFKEIIIIK